jgi:squalene-hopene/tetraprenyl-beta-curcumene cyclase
LAEFITAPLNPVDEGRLDSAIERSQQFLLGLQYPEGYWWGELESNPTMEAEYILLSHFLGIADETKNYKIANHIKNRQREDGTWGQFFGAPGDLSTSIECYFALKLTGESPESAMMTKARQFILSKGGVPNARVFTKIWLSLFGQYEWRGVPVMPPEIMLLPNWFPVTIYDFSSWARATIVPLLIILDKKPIVTIAEDAAIDELYVLPRHETDYSIRRPRQLIGWETFFYAGDLVLRNLEKFPWKFTRSQALRRAEEWIVERQEADGSWGGIQPPWVYSLMALHTLGYSNNHSVMVKGIQGWDTFSLEEADTIRIQACISPVWDTSLAMIGLLDSGIAPDDPAIQNAADWLIAEQVLRGGDWQIKAKEVPPGGWAFEFHNDVYPDIDDTAEIVMALESSRPADLEKRDAALQRAVHWLFGMQSANGGWGAFDKDNNKVLIAKIPFADFGETIDPPSVDVTAHVLEMFGQLGYSLSHPQIAKAVDYVLSEQEHDGAWFGRWGVNYIYGIGAVLPALEKIGFDMTSQPVRRAVDWLVDHQNTDGGWGESCFSYVDAAFRGRGPSTASQTAWAIIALLAAGEGESLAAQRGIEYLIAAQLPDGSWDEPYYTGTGFPGYGIGQRLTVLPDQSAHQGSELGAGFMINYHMYRLYWPLSALGRYRRRKTGGSKTPKIRHSMPEYPSPNRSQISLNRLKRLLPLW